MVEKKFLLEKCIENPVAEQERGGSENKLFMVCPIFLFTFPSPSPSVLIEVGESGTVPGLDIPKLLGMEDQGTPLLVPYRA